MADRPQASAGDTAPDRARGALTLVVLIGLGAIIGLLLLIGAQRPGAAIADCRASNAPLTEISGRLRLAGPDYYLVDGERWHLLHAVCAGKARQACLEATQHAEEWLEAHTGETVTANVCAHGVVDYTVANRRFFR